MPTKREFSGAAKRTTLVGDITPTSTTAQIADATGYPTGATAPFVVTFDLGLAGEEKCLATRSGNSLTLTARGFDGTTAANHGTGSVVDHTFSAVDAREANDHTIDTTGDPHPQYVNQTEGDAQYVRTVGGSTVTAASTTTRGLVVKAASAQSAALTEWQDSAGAVQAQVTAKGSLNVLGHFLAVSQADAATYPYTTSVITTGAAKTGLVVQGRAAQTGDLQQWWDSAGTVLCAVKASGQLHALQTAAIGPTGNDGTVQVLIVPSTASRSGLLVRAASAQAADIVQYQNSAGATIANVNASGALGGTDLDGAGFRQFRFGPPDSAGTGFRTVRVAN